MGPDFGGVYPGPNDVIITGRSYEEKSYTDKMLTSKGINNIVYYNPLKFSRKTRESSGYHKAKIISGFNSGAYGNIMRDEIVLHFEDDPIQAEIIRTIANVQVVLLEHNLIEKENVWHGEEDLYPILRRDGLSPPPSLREGEKPRS